MNVIEENHALGNVRFVHLGADPTIAHSAPPPPRQPSRKRREDSLGGDAGAAGLVTAAAWGDPARAAWWRARGGPATRPHCFLPGLRASGRWRGSAPGAAGPTRDKPPPRLTASGTR